jgi:integrase
VATINFFLQSKKNPAGIYVRVRETGTDAKAKTRFIIDPDQWSSSKGQPKNLKSAEYKKLQQELSDFKSSLMTHYNQSVGKAPINSDWLKEFINPSKKESAIPTKLTEYFDFYARHKKTSMKSSTHTKLNVNKHLIERFQKELKREYHVCDVDANFKLDLENYCLKEKYSEGTIARLMKFVKTVCYHARENGVETNRQLDGIRAIKPEPSEKIYLTPKELKAIQKVEFDKDYLDNARDWLIISCETGQRVSDFLRFKKEMIRVEKGKPLIEFTQKKTERIMTVPLSKTVLKILKKRKGEFPRKISDQKYNEYIKLVCKEAGLRQKINGSIAVEIDKGVYRKEQGIYEKWQLVSSHIGRRSFATNNYGRVPTALLISATGHATEQMFLEYIGKTDTQKALELANYF